MSRLRVWVIRVLLAVFCLAGLWVSYHEFRWQWHIEGDIASPYLVWKQVLRDGPGVLLEWRYAQDNWLFSLTLPDFVLLGLTGSSPWVFLHQGWLFFLLNSLLTYAILQFATSRTVAAVVAIAMLFAGPAVIGGVIYLTYPVTHNSSLVWGLACLWLYLLWLRGGRWLWLILGSIALFIGDMSDPWLAAAMVLPIVLGACVAGVLTSGFRLRFAAIAFCAFAVLALARIRLFWLLWFLPGSDFSIGGPSFWLPHLGWIATYTTLMFNVVPIRQPGFGWFPPVWLIVVDCLVIAIVGVWAIGRLLRQWRALRPEAMFIAATAVIGCGGIAAAFVISTVNANLNVGRYISNWFYFIPLAVAIAAFGLRMPRPDWLTRVAVLWCALLVIAGVAAEPHHQTSLPDDIATADTRDLIRFLDQHGLNYGYAPFWATHGAAAEWMTDGRIVIRPVSRSSSGHIVPRIAQTFPSWYESSDVPPGQKQFFYIAKPDEEICTDYAACVALATSEWGEPQRVLKWGDIPVMVWDRPTLTGLPNAAQIAEAPVLQPGVPVRFTRDGIGGALQGRGWSGVEETASWTDAREAVLKIHLPDGWSGPATLVFESSAFPSRTKRNPQTVTVLADGKVLTTWTMPPFKRQTYEVVIPAEIAEKRLIALVLQVPGATRPSDFAYVYDVRPLGVYLMSVTLRR
ncbi:MAG: hypothetical protein JSS43_23425 [Proteobacteria bacterium]|nr:hypothetical protein [Pseudomonadota bacterium]